jgi:DNA processing protein
MPPGELSDWIALNSLSGVGPTIARRLLQRFSDPGVIAYRLGASDLRSAGGLRDDAVGAILASRPGLRRRAEEEVRACERLGIRLLTPGDPGYPAEFEVLPDGPVVLYMKGALTDGVVRIAVVGSRRATAYGRRVATGLASGLGLQGVEIVSGGARGIDTCAHLGALEAGARTIVVMGSGFRQLYPPENEDLFDRIAENGAIMTEFHLDMEPRGENFPRRNRLIAGLAAAVVVVEAAERSGSLSTAGHALEQGREVMAVPGPVSSEQSAGCHRLIQQGAKLVHSVGDVLEELSPMYSAALAPKVPAPEGDPGPDLAGIGPDEVAVLALLDDPEPVQLDALADRAPFGIARLQTALFGLEVRGAVEQLPGRYYLARPRRGA